MFEFIKTLFSRGKSSAHSAEELRADFKDRYRQFRLLLRANNRVLDIMAEIEEALEGTQPFGMMFVRERCLRASGSVHSIIHHLNNLSSGKYEALHAVFDSIRGKISPYIDFANLPREGPLALSLSEIGKEQADQVGAKMANLGEVMNKIGLKTPSGFVITTAGYHRFMDHNRLQPEIAKRMRATKMDQLDELYDLSTALRQIVIDASIPPDLEKDISDRYQALKETEGGRLAVAVRSSALGEDLQRSTFAGLYSSVLNVRSENILAAYKEVLASKYSLPAMTYRLSRGIRDEDVAMCVGCMAMVDAVSGGVLYSRNPLDIRDDSVAIDSMWGVPKSVVDGSVKTDHFAISRSEPFEIREKEIPPKSEKYVCRADEGVSKMEMTGEQAREASISDEQALELARLAIRLEQHYQAPQDIEWCIDKDQSIIILQCRPLRQIEVSRQTPERTTEGAERGSVLLQGGVTAAPGVAAGPAFTVRSDPDVLKFPKGAVLVAARALPQWATLLDRAAAVVTEQGGVAGHLANVAREFGVPALFSIKGAIDTLSPGETVTVDANGRKVYEGRIQELLRIEEKARNLMEGSAVHEALKGAAEYIVPLHLLDPDAISFKPEGCKTLHDITRFCHEKSVSEMFNFGKDHHFPERSSKQLMVEAPLKWWVLNLDDGFREEVAGKYVKLGNIQSFPMLALWEGIVATPWAGPPPIDGKGLLSVMFQATQNPALTTGVPSKYADRNYFMVSKNYCSLTSRLGFHFATVEAMVGDNPSENYISFQFKGGAADYERRRKRVFFVKEILEGYHFRVQIKEDNLMARLEDYDKDFMMRNLRIIGYLAIHTRQLDMIMSNSALVKQYRARICKDIQELFVREKILYLYIGDEEK